MFVSQKKFGTHIGVQNLRLQEQIQDLGLGSTVPCTRWFYQKRWFTMQEDFLGHPEPNPSWILFSKVGNR